MLNQAAMNSDKKGFDDAFNLMVLSYGFNLEKPLPSEWGRGDAVEIIEIEDFEEMMNELTINGIIKEKIIESIKFVDEMNIVDDSICCKRMEMLVNLQRKDVGSYKNSLKASMELCEDAKMVRSEVKKSFQDLKNLIDDDTKKKIEDFFISKMGYNVVWY
jgi:hypothetical protein